MARKENDNLSEISSEIIDQYTDLLLSSIESILAEHRETMEEALSSTARAKRVPVALEHAISEAVRSDWHTAIEEVGGDSDDDDDVDDEEEEDEEEDEFEEEELDEEEDDEEDEDYR